MNEESKENTGICKDSSKAGIKAVYITEWNEWKESGGFMPSCVHNRVYEYEIDKAFLSEIQFTTDPIPYQPTIVFHYPKGKKK
jgi:hypothetical protein